MGCMNQHPTSHGGPTGISDLQPRGIAAGGGGGDGGGLSRRELVRVMAVGAAGMLAAGTAAHAAGLAGWAGAPKGKPEAGKGGGEKLKILILGGTAFTGPQLVRLAVDAGHTVTIFNRGRTEQRIGGIPDSVERLVGDRDPKVAEGLKALEGDRTWDVCIDLSGQYPRHVGASAKLLAGRVKHYTFVSSISAYTEPYPEKLDEEAPLAKLADPNTEDMAGGMNYGGLKAACEKAAMEAMPGKVAVVRPGLIVGPGDQTDRFTYWPVRFSRAAAGEAVLCPNDASDPAQWIDVRDLAEWMLKLAVDRPSGAFNAVGQPGSTMGSIVDACMAATGKKAKPVWGKLEVLMQERVTPWGDMPVWVPRPEKGQGWFGNVNFDKAVKAGLKFRPVQQTVSDTLAWWPSEMARRERVGKELTAQAEKDGKPAPKLPPHDQLRAGITAEREKAVLAKLA